MTEIGQGVRAPERRLRRAGCAPGRCRRGSSAADVDGLLDVLGVTQGPGLGLSRTLGLTGLRLQSDMQSFGATAGATVQYAAMAVMAGMAQAVVCVFADALLRGGPCHRR